MANICTNLFYASSEKAETIDAIRAFIEEHFPDDWHEQSDNFQIEAELYSRWDFPKSLFEELGQEPKSRRHSLYALPIPRAM